jgi:PAS domain S-box-containing protein
MNVESLGRNLWRSPYSKIFLAGIIFAAGVALLLGNVYRGQVELQKSVVNNFRHDLEKHAAALSYFFSERKNDLKNLPAKREISIYFENKALGMSMEYGLRASLTAIHESFDQVLKERMLGPDRIYTRFVFADGSGACLSDTQKTPDANMRCKEFLTPDSHKPFILVKRLDDSAQLIVSSPYFFKGRYSGQIVAWISMTTLHKHLIGSTSQSHQKIFRVFSRQENFFLPTETKAPATASLLPNIAALPDRQYSFYKASARSGTREEMFSTWVPIQETPLLLVGVIPARELFGYLSPKLLLLIMGSLSIIFTTGVAVVWWTNTRNMILRTRLEEAAIREREIGEKNRQLEEEIIQRRRVGEALRSAEEKYRTIFENAVEGIFQSTPDGHPLSANPAMAKIHGYSSPEEWMTEITDIKHQVYVDAKRRDEFVKVMDNEGFVKGFESQIYKKDGAKVWISESARAVHDDNANLLYYEGFVQDVTERKEAEELSRNLITASPIGIFILQDGRFRVANHWFHEITSIDKDELSQVVPTKLIHPDDQPEVIRKATGMLEGKSSTPYEYRLIAKGGKIKWIVETVIPSIYQGKEAVLGFFMDITGHKELEKQLLQAQKMEAVGRLAGGVAHDFNNMLGAIIGYTEMLMQRLNREDSTYHYSEEIRKAADRAAMLTRQLLAFSRKQVLQPRKLNLNVVIKDLEKMLRRLISENIELDLHLDRALTAVKADAGQMEQVILNLAVNARDAMPQGGKLTMSTTNVNLDETYVRKQEDVTPGSYIVLEVRDNGLGMDADTLDHIFEPFFTTKDPGSGTGLGLSTAYGIIKQSGGFIEVESNPGAGTIFKIFLPATGESEEDSEGEPAERDPLRGSETILVVEDEEILRQLIKAALEMNGYKVLEARNARDAVELCEQNKPPIHLMLTDVVMPKMSGRELAQRLARLRPELKVIYMSGYAEDVLLRQGVLDSSITFLQKPFRQYELTAKVRKVLDSRPKG